jgi:hypothetical protein
MRKYETISKASTQLATELYLNHANIPQDMDPDWSGERVDSFDEFTDVSLYVQSLDRVLSRSTESFQIVPDTMEVDNILAMKDLCNTDSVKKLFTECRNFQRKSVKDWNPKADEVTKTLLLGVVAIDESSKEGCGAVYIDLSLKHGFLDENDDYSWKKSATFEDDRMSVVGDRKSTENTSAFCHLLQGRVMTLDEVGRQAQVFVDAYRKTSFQPGDWHTSMNILQFIVKIYWTVLLKPMADAMGWKRINPDASKCYYAVGREVKYLNGELHRYLWHGYISAKGPEYRQLMLNQSNVDADVVVNMCRDYHRNVEQLIKSRAIS